MVSTSSTSGSRAAYTTLAGEMYTVAEMARSRLVLTRSQILAFRRHVGALDERLPRGARSLRRAAWAGLQDSMPRAALLQIHARVEGTGPSSWEHPSLVQVWGPRYSTYVVPARDFALFTRARLPDGGKTRANAEDYAARLHDFLAGRRMTDREVGAGARHRQSHAIRHADRQGPDPLGGSSSAAGLDRPDTRDRTACSPSRSSRADTCTSSVPRRRSRSPGGQGSDRRTASRRSRHCGGRSPRCERPIGDAWMLTRDEPELRSPGPPAAARLLPSGDAYFLLQGADRELVVPQPERRAQLWTSRVWPGAVLVEGEIVGTWRRAGRR